MRKRIEQDSLGNIRVPAKALWGAQTARAVENFQISSRTAHPALIRAYLRVKSAAARANAKSGAITRKEERLILAAIAELLKMPETDWAEIFPIDPYQAGAGTSQNMNINEVIANVANRKVGRPLGSYSPIHPNNHVNRSQSTNDTFPTAMRLALLEVSKSLTEETTRLAKSFAAKAQAWHRIPKSARTHLQDAVPMRLGQEVGAYSVTIEKCSRWISDGRDALRVLGLGGSAAGTGLTVPRGYPKAAVRELEKLTGEKLFFANDLCEAMQSQSPILYFSSMLRLYAVECTRICNDLRLLASGPLTGLSELQLPAVQPGSSIMPGKVNPSILEMANQVWFSVLGYDHAVAQSTQAGQLELNVMMPVMAYSAIEATRIATNATAALRECCVDGLQPNEARLRKYFESTPQIATALSPKLGYAQTAKLVMQALEEGRSIVEIVRERQLISEKELQPLLSVEALTGSSG